MHSTACIAVRALCIRQGGGGVGGGALKQERFEFGTLAKREVGCYLVITNCC